VLVALRQNSVAGEEKDLALNQQEMENPPPKNGVNPLWTLVLAVSMRTTLDEKLIAINLS